MKVKLFSINEETPLIHNEIHPQNFGTELSKDIWIHICSFLPFRQILNLTLLNKKFYQQINSNESLWREKLIQFDQEKKNSIQHMIKQVSRIDLSLPFNGNLPGTLDKWKEKKRKKIIVLDFFKAQQNCEEKKKFIEFYTKNRKKVILEKDTLRSLDIMYYFNQFFVYTLLFILPFLVFVCITLLELKLTNKLKIYYFFTTTPLLLFSLLFMVYLCYFTTTLNKKYNYLNIIFVKKFPFILHFFICSVLSLVSFIVLTALKIDQEINLNWNIIFVFFYLSFLILLIGIIALGIVNKGSKFSFLMSIVLLFLSSICILLHLSVINVINSKHKWAISMTPWLILSVGPLFLFFFFLFNMRCQSYDRVIINISGMIVTASLITSVFLLFFHLMDYISFLPFFIVLQVGLLVFLVFSHYAIK